MKWFNRFLIALIPVILLAGCASKPTAPTSSTGAAPAPATEEAAPAAETTAMPAESAFSGDPLDDPDSLLAERVIYFDFDKSNIKNKYRDILKAHAEYLASHPGVKVVLEGHCDERGTREYNMGLGERRANAVNKFMMLMGVSNSQTETVSYGEERPVAFGHDEASWALNRRVEIVYPGR